jgi:hypothetical protein
MPGSLSPFRAIAAEDLPTLPIELAIEPSKTILLTKLSNLLFYLMLVR